MTLISFSSAFPLLGLQSCLAAPFYRCVWSSGPRCPGRILALDTLWNVPAMLPGRSGWGPCAS